MTANCGPYKPSMPDCTLPRGSVGLDCSETETCIEKLENPCDPQRRQRLMQKVPATRRRLHTHMQLASTTSELYRVILTVCLGSEESGRVLHCTLKKADHLERRWINDHMLFSCSLASSLCCRSSSGRR